MADNRQIQFGIREIKELEFFVDEYRESTNLSILITL